MENCHRDSCSENLENTTVKKEMKKGESRRRQVDIALGDGKREKGDEKKTRQIY